MRGGSKKAGVIVWETGGVAPAGGGLGPPLRTITGGGAAAYGVIAEETGQFGSASSSDASCRRRAAQRHA